MLRCLLILFLIPFFMCSCSKDNRETITFSSWGSITEVGVINNVIDNFEKSNPEIKIKFIHIPQNYFQKLHLLFVSNCEPDVIFINNLYLPLYAEKLSDLSNIADESDFYPQSIDAMKINGELLAVPRDISNFVFYYNKDLLQGSIGSNFSDFFKTISENTDTNHWGISFERNIMYAEPYIMTLGYNEGLEFYKNLEGKYAPHPWEVGSSTSAQMFLDKKIVFYMSGRWMYPKIKESADFRWGVITFPGLVPADASGWAISKSSKHKSSAEKFVKYLSSKENMEYFTSTGLIVPSRKDSSKSLENKNEQAFIDAIKKSKFHKITKNYKKDTDRLNKELFN